MNKVFGTIFLVAFFISVFGFLCFIANKETINGVIIEKDNSITVEYTINNNTKTITLNTKYDYQINDTIKLHIINHSIYTNEHCLIYLFVSFLLFLISSYCFAYYDIIGKTPK